MASAAARKGRPKGSGIDDSQQLARIAALLAADPKLRPTTAIRLLGIEEPSVIRRLRDKYRAHQAAMQEAARSQSPPKGKPTVAARRDEEPRRRSRSHAPPSINWDTTTTDIFVAWCGFGFSAVSAAIENQYVIAQHFLHQPSISIAVKNQLVINQFTLAMYQRTRRRSIHAN